MPRNLVLHRENSKPSFALLLELLQQSQLLALDFMHLLWFVSDNVSTV